MIGKRFFCLFLLFLPIKILLYDACRKIIYSNTSHIYFPLTVPQYLSMIPILPFTYGNNKEYIVKKTKRILALIGVILLVGLYITTLVLAIVDSSATMDLFRGSIFATVVIPTIIWAYTYIYQLFSKKKDHDDSDSTEKNN